MTSLARRAASVLARLSSTNDLAAASMAPSTSEAVEPQLIRAGH
jgi:hypothetical protein